MKRKVGEHPRSPGNQLNNTHHFSGGIGAPLGVDQQQMQHLNSLQMKAFTRNQLNLNTQGGSKKNSQGTKRQLV